MSICNEPEWITHDGMFQEPTTNIQIILTIRYANLLTPRQCGAMIILGSQFMHLYQFAVFKLPTAFFNILVKWLTYCGQGMCKIYKCRMISFG